MNILITGAGRGLGYELAAEALKRGHGVIAGVRRPDQEQTALSQLAATYGEKLTVAQLDVTDEEGIAALAANLQGQGRTLGAIINNAAVLTARDTQIEELDLQDMLTTMDINLYGPMRVVKHFLPLLTEPELSIINISSEAGSITNAYAGDYPYSISKTALNMFSQQLHVYLKERGVQVLGVHPGWMHTDMGGAEAPTNPTQSAEGIMDLIEKRTTPEGQFMFVDYTGKDMKI
ncbi:SDR family oxidoreductase [Paenibacillus sp. FSL H7-0716]|uniref:Short-chain dehydrogenase n=1 Tax=Paenibacillus odorifer TaxID=189426 RepID=A0A1R0YVA1_9BACL|nr:SDR family oxidoreductase [Paenibacillus odorifer]AWV32443.1 short-chain dehydrogenase [Paenibacillus odorifer]OME11177.1 short-chain dehydrogenase [Paenibacillus odorifer]OME13448.1 short-chain dehydrogenase [Paenibacillus odorifer]